MFVPLYYMALVLLPAFQNSQAAAQPAPSDVPNAGAASGGSLSAEALSPVKEALRSGKYPWYDAGADRVRPVWTPGQSWVKWLGGKLRSIGEAIGRFFRWLGLGRLPAGGKRGESLGTMLLLTVLAAFFVLLLVIWLRREPYGAGSSANRAKPGTALLMAELPDDLRPGLDDPWAEAQRRRLARDFAGAVIYLFAHQLLSLHRAGLIRLAPGWTGRQYVRWLRDPVLVDSLGSTLRLFEEIYYGHRLPSAEAFERVWSRAQALEERRAKLEASP